MSTKCFLSIAHLVQLSQANSAKAGAAAPAVKPVRRYRGGARAALALALFAGATTAAGCGSDDLRPNVVVVDHTTAPLSLGALNAINGTYGAGCIGRSGSWSSPIGGYSGALDNSPLSVVKANSACVLTLTSVLIGSIKYEPASTVNLSDSYAGSAVAYTAEGETAIAFYGNLKLSDATFTSSFSISLLYSDDAAAASAELEEAQRRAEAAIPGVDWAGRTARQASLLEMGWWLLRIKLWNAWPNGKTARFYSITATGRRQLTTEKEQWTRLTEGVELVMAWRES